MPRPELSATQASSPLRAARALSQDFHTAKLRIVMSPIIVGYILYSNHWVGGAIDTRQLAFDILGFLHLAYALFGFGYFFRSPQPNVPLRLVGTLTDHAGVVLALAVTASSAVVISWLPLFILTGVALRFGSRLLVMSYPVALMDFALVYYLNPWWAANPSVTAGVVLFTAIIPLYLLPLAKRNEKRAELLGIEKQAAEAARQAAEDQRRVADEQAHIAKEQTAKAEHASAAKTQFLATMSHELRTPLAGIVGINEILLDTQAIPAEGRRLLLQQRDAAALMLSSVNDILDISKVEVGEMEAESIPFDLPRTIAEIVNGLRYQADSKGLRLFTQIHAATPTAVIGSPFHLTRVVQNLLSNAIKFTKKGSVTIRLCPTNSLDGTAGVEERSGRSWVRIEVEDTGIGIPKEAAAHIFDRFFQVDASITRKFGGTGLGTTIVKEFVTLLGGDVTLESEPGEGTMFAAELPFQTPLSDDEPKLREKTHLLAADLAPEQIEVLRHWADAHGSTLSLVRDAVDVAASIRASERIPATGVCVIVGSRNTQWSALRQGLADEGVTFPPTVMVGEMPRWRDRAAGSTPKASTTGSPLDTVWLGHPESGVRRLASALSMLRVQGETREGVGSNTLTKSRDQGARDVSLARPPKGIRIMVAEDSNVIQIVFNHYLSGFAQLTMVDDGARALSIASTDPFDIIILDYHMPNMSGIEVARALRAGDGPNKTGKILFATAASTPDVIDECKRAGADEMIGKPFKREVLFAALVRLSAGMQIKPDEERRPVAAES